MDQVWRKRKCRHKRRFRPESVVISKKGDMTFAGILRKVISDPVLIDLGENVSRIRRSQKEDLMLELKKSSGKIVENFLGKVEKSLGKEA